MAASRHDLHRSRSALLPTAAIGFFGYFLAALLLMHVIRPDYTIVDHMISDYAVGQFGWIMTTAFTTVSPASRAINPVRSSGNPYVS